MCYSHYTYLLLFLCLTFFSFSASAQPQQHEYKAGMSYTAIAAAKYTAPQDNARSLHIKSLKPSNALKDKKSPLPSGISADVWEKYKSLAAGNAADKIEKETKMAAATPAPQAQPAEKTQTTPAQNTGIAAILNAYQQNKKQRSQMRTLTITKPQ